MKAPQDGVLSDAALTEIVKHKQGGGRLKDSTSGEAVAQPAGQSAEDFLLGIAKGCPAGCILVDLTATDATIPALLHAATGGSGLRAVTANKKPVSGPLAAFKDLVLTPGGSARFRYEATVGAGLPVIAALQRVVGADDTVSGISGSFSGTRRSSIAAQPSPTALLTRRFGGRRHAGLRDVRVAGRQALFGGCGEGEGVGLHRA